MQRVLRCAAGVMLVVGLAFSALAAAQAPASTAPASADSIVQASQPTCDADFLASLLQPVPLKPQPVQFTCVQGTPCTQAGDPICGPNGREGHCNTFTHTCLCT